MRRSCGQVVDCVAASNRAATSGQHTIRALTDVALVVVDLLHVQPPADRLPHERAPARALHTRARSGQLVAEPVEASEAVVDRVGEVALRLAAAVGREVRPEDRVQDMAGEMEGEVLLQHVHGAELVVAARLVEPFEGLVRPLHVRRMMLVVVELDDARRHGGLERGVVVGQVGKGVDGHADRIARRPRRPNHSFVSHRTHRTRMPRLTGAGDAWEPHRRHGTSSGDISMRKALIFVATVATLIALSATPALAQPLDSSPATGVVGDVVTVSPQFDPCTTEAVVVGLWSPGTVPDIDAPFQETPITLNSADSADDSVRRTRHVDGAGDLHGLAAQSRELPVRAALDHREAERTGDDRSAHDQPTHERADDRAARDCAADGPSDGCAGHRSGCAGGGTGGGG
jgi:hypothetical protein